MVKDNSISSLSNYPTGRDKDFCEDMTSKQGPSSNDHVQWGQVQVPVYINRAPACSAKRPLKEKVNACFLQISIAQNTGIVF